MELSQGQAREANQDTTEDGATAVIGQKAVGNRVKMSGRRPDGSLYEYNLPTQPLGVFFTTEGPIELSLTDENH